MHEDQNVRFVSMKRNVAEVAENRLMVLLVEDDADIRMLIKTYLDAQGFWVVDAESVDVALASWAKHAQDPHVILSDLHLGAKSGYDLYWGCRKAHNTLPFIMMSSDPFLQNEAPDDPNLVMMAKPFSFKTLSAILARYELWPAGAKT